MRISQTDNTKRLINMALWWLNREYRKDPNSKDIEEDINACGDVTIKKIHKVIWGIFFSCCENIYISYKENISLGQE